MSIDQIITAIQAQLRRATDGSFIVRHGIPNPVVTIIPSQRECHLVRIRPDDLRSIVVLMNGKIARFYPEQVRIRGLGTPAKTTT